ncbi:hypothetical protein [Ramlibacter sp.]|uniref:hypothetical protein n=1 Tax=Ramlibacter sp. TaxID=1917967 RepID=UPI002FC60C66
MPVRLTIGADAYALAEEHDGEGSGFALLPRGAEALLPSTRPVDEARLEAAIETAEDWLMPHAARLRGQVLDVSDPTGRLRSGMEDVLAATTRAWSVQEVEGFFLRLVDMTTGRLPAPSVAGRQQFVADVLLLRELAHHGQVREIRLV